MKQFLTIICLVLVGFSQNPEMDGFNKAESDPKAIEIADKVMESLGGYENWNNTQYIAWKFFGRRMHYWNKWTGDHRMESKGRVTIMNLNTMKGKMYVNGVEETNPDSLMRYFKSAKSAWINDSYWMFMPYKLKDSGVTLKYQGEGKMMDGKSANILQLTFENVGDTPDNKYLVYVNKDNNMVEQWDFFRKYNDEKPGFTTPWHNWTKHGNIMLSADRGKWKHSNVAVFNEFDKELFNSHVEIEYSKLNMK